MKLFQWTGQPFEVGRREVSTHFLAGEWTRAGHEVHVATVGLSQLTRLKDPALYSALAVQQKNRFQHLESGVRVTAYMPLVHPFSSRNGLINALNEPLFRAYGAHLPCYLRRAISQADVVFFEPGTSLSFFHAVRKANPAAALVYIMRDSVGTIGAAPYLQDLERRILGAFDLVITPSTLIAESIPGARRIGLVPQGLNKELLDQESVSPYAAGTRNAISIGNMLFDEKAVGSIAAAAPDVTIHAFGARFKDPLPDNVVDHGEQSFSKIVPYIQHADFGLAPYALQPEDLYLGETSLKFLQYAYCRLPVLAPDVLADRRGNRIGYALHGEKDWSGKVAAALAMPKSDAFRADILDWAQVAARYAALAEEARAQG